MIALLVQADLNRFTPLSLHRLCYGLILRLWGQYLGWMDRITGSMAAITNPLKSSCDSQLGLLGPDGTPRAFPALICQLSEDRTMIRLEDASSDWTALFGLWLAADTRRSWSEPWRRELERVTHALVNSPQSSVQNAHSAWHFSHNHNEARLYT